MFAEREARPLAVSATGDLGKAKGLEALGAFNPDRLPAAQIGCIDGSMLNGGRGTPAGQAGRRAAAPGAIREASSRRVPVELITRKTLILYVAPVVKGKAVREAMGKVVRRTTGSWFADGNLCVPSPI